MGLRPTKINERRRAEANIRRTEVRLSTERSGEGCRDPEPPGKKAKGKKQKAKGKSELDALRAFFIRRATQRQHPLARRDGRGAKRRQSWRREAHMEPVLALPCPPD